MTFAQKLAGAVKQNNSLLCVGLDPDMEKLPEHIKHAPQAFFTFNKAIVDATADLVCTFKPNSAFYEALGANGIEQLKETCDYIRARYPHIPILLDYKRGDIGHTNSYYTQFAFDYLQVDAVTISPYLGKTANQEFLDRKDKGIAVLCRTSNPGAGEFQDLEVEGQPLYQRVSQHVMNEWNENNNCLLVLGATYADELTQVRKLVGPEIIFLVPGVGAQGGDLAGFVQAGVGKDNQGLIINSSRQVLYASSGENFAEAARAEALKTRDEINKYRS